MARKSYGRTSSLLNVGTYQDDDSYPVGSNEWNANHSDDGVIGFDKSAQAISGNNNINVTDSFIEITTADSASGGSNDGIYTLSAITTAHSTTNYPADTSNSNVKLRSNASSYSEGDLIYVVKAAGQAATTLRHQQGGAGAGKITTLDGEHKVLSATVPTILMARTISGNVEWIEYGGGAVTTPTDITVADESSDTTCFPLFATAATGDLPPKSGSNLLFNSSSGLLTATGFAGALTGAVTGNADTATSATTATTATNVTVADESSDTSCNVLFSTAATGNLPPKSGTNLTFNSSSGLLTATLFAGDLTGAVTGNADTATSATTATTATNVTVADESSDASCNVLFTTAATGNLPPKSGTNLTFDSNTGILSAVGLTLSGDLTVNGTTTTIDTATLSVEDPLINMASGNNAADSVDIGFYGLYDTSGSQDLYAGLFRDANDSGKWKLFKDNQAAPTTTVNIGGTGYAVGTLVANLEGAGALTQLTMTGGIAMGGNDITNGKFIWLTEQTGAGSNIAGKGQIWVDDSVPNRLFFTDDAGGHFDLTSGGGASATHAYTNQSSTTYYGTGSSGTGIDRAVVVGTEASGAGEREIYIKQIDSNNEGVFTVIHKNGSTVEVQIA